MDLAPSSESMPLLRFRGRSVPNGLTDLHYLAQGVVHGLVGTLQRFGFARQAEPVVVVVDVRQGFPAKIPLDAFLAKDALATGGKASFQKGSVGFLLEA